MIEIGLRIEGGDLVVPFLEQVARFLAVNLAQHILRRPSFDRGAADGRINQADGHSAGHEDPASEDVTDGGELFDSFGRTDIPIALAEMRTEPVAPLV